MQYVCINALNLIVSWPFSQALSTESYERCTCQLGNTYVTLNVNVRGKCDYIKLQVDLLNIHSCFTYFIHDYYTNIHKCSVGYFNIIIPVVCVE